MWKYIYVRWQSTQLLAYFYNRDDYRPIIIEDYDKHKKTYYHRKNQSAVDYKSKSL